ncbi:MAG: TMEM143 family protein [Pirellulaceae bacterium]
MIRHDVAKNPLQPFEREGENFIPLRHTALIERVKQWLELSTTDDRTFEKLCDRLTAIFHIEHLHNLLRVEKLYGSLDPDDETESADSNDTADNGADAENLLDRISSVLYTAHYHRLTSEDLAEAVRIGCQWGVQLDVDFELFENLLVFARGYRLVKKKRRLWQKFFREETIEQPEFHRLVIAFRVKDESRLKNTFRPNTVYLKMFKNIPETDLEVLLPGSTVRLSLFDRGKILFPTISGAALTIYKIVKGVMLVTLATMTALWNWLLLIALLIGYITRSIFSYWSTRDKYQLGLTQNLYLKNLDNNLGAIYRLFKEAEEQEICETILVYGVLLKSGLPLAEPELKAKALRLLKEITSQKVVFDIHDALGKLARLHLAEVDADGRWRASALLSAPNLVAEYWERQLQIETRRF